VKGKKGALLALCLLLGSCNLPAIRGALGCAAELVTGVRSELAEPSWRDRLNERAATEGQGAVACALRAILGGLVGGVIATPSLQPLTLNRRDERPLVRSRTPARPSALSPTRAQVPDEQVMVDRAELWLLANEER
jgi:hypothetical protein